MNVFGKRDQRSLGQEKHASLMIQQSWKHVLAIARNDVDQIPIHLASTAPQTHRSVSPQHRLLASQQLNDATYDRERLMVQALDTLFSLTGEGHGYVTFLATMVTMLEPECPVSMAFLSHVIDRATLPSKETLRGVSPAILAKLNHAHIHTDARHIVRTWRRIASWNKKKTGMPHHHPKVNIKRNAVMIWAILAEKFAGEMIHTLWSDQVASCLIQLVANYQEDCTVRLYSLLALEKFALTGDIKNKIKLHPSGIFLALKMAIDQCTIPWSECIQTDDDDTSCDSDLEPDLQTVPSSPLSTMKQYLADQKRRLTWRVRKLSDGRKPKQPDEDNVADGNATLSLPITLATSVPTAAPAQPCPPPILNHSTNVPDDDVISHLNLSDYDPSPNGTRTPLDLDTSVPQGFGQSCRTSSTPGSSRRLDNLHRMELSHAARWSLHNVFVDRQLDEKLSWDLQNLHVIVNPFDSTPHWKFGSNGLEIRNDRLQFESARATVCVKQGKWYYEVLLVTEGIMQIGWCTSRCRFIPEEGYGVGDDQHGFAFDTYRSAVWANGTAVYPQSLQPSFRCRAGDVLGSYLDLDEGICSFFINGQDIGMTVAFEHASTTKGGTMEGLYPAFSLTTHQHILINFGDRPWMYEPDLPLPSPGQSAHWHGVHLAPGLNGHHGLETQLQQRVLQWSAQRPYCDIQGSHLSTTPSLRPALTTQLSQELDWDGPLCTMCFTEPKNTVLIPCGHGGWGASCAKLLDSCPLCRNPIEKTIVEDINA
ncbi:SPRY-domain-containing protein [Hesseltinella vesiculosa]|uniref:SPRY-domain-containing protein n=1 Tax=Hesseltinella vesiculosa TaxID=101127 RepID=A0A1X2GBF6_9FUNG|nr:SPRY-domain-containing protein [Hesseltinella vesiculosa]